MKNPIVHFEIHASDVKRATKFYQDVFGWEIKQWSDWEYWMVMTGAPTMTDTKSTDKGINGGMLIRKGDAPKEGQAVNAFVCTALVENIDHTIANIEKAGGTVAVSKHALVGMAWQAYYKDTEGNIFGIHQPDENAR